VPKKPQPTRVTPFGPPQDGYYKTTVDRAGNSRPEEGRVRHTRADLPAPRPGKEWTEYQNIDGEIYFVEQSSASGDAARRRKAEQDKRDAEAAAERRRQAAEEAANPPERPVFEPGQESGLSHMREMIDYHRKKLGDIFGFTVKVKDGLGNSRTLVQAGDVSTSVRGTNLGPVTVGPDGRPVAVKVGAATVTEDGRVIAGRGVKIGKYGAGVDAKVAVDAGNAGVGAATELTEGVVDEAVRRIPKIGGTSADGGG
jgi:hypothetical protein